MYPPLATSPTPLDTVSVLPRLHRDGLSLQSAKSPIVLRAEVLQPYDEKDVGYQRNSKRNVRLRDRQASCAAEK